MTYIFVGLIILAAYFGAFAYYFRKKDLLYKLVALFVITCLCEFLKRFIYIFGDIGNEPYYAVLFIPDAVIILDLCILVFGAKFKPSIIWLMVFLVVMIFIALLNGQDLVSIAIMLRTVFLPTLLLFAITEDDITKLNYRVNLTHFILIMCVSSLYGSYQFFFGYPIWESNWDIYSPANMSLSQITNHGEIERAFGFFSEVSGQGISIGIAILYVVSRIRHRLLKVGLLSVLLLGLITAFSKTALLALLIVIIGWKVVFRFRRFVYLLVPAGLLLLANAQKVIFLVIEGMRASLGGALLAGLDPATLLARVHTINMYVEEMTVVSFLLGNGFGYVGGITMDNLFIYVLYKCGIVGLFALVYLFVKIMMDAPKMGGYEAFVFPAILFFIIVSMTTINLTARSGLLLLLIVLVVGWRSKNMQRLRCLNI